jgi:DNA polymerase elongation subunit (family B)
MQFNIEKLLFFDIETVGQYKDLDELPKEKLKLWLSYYNNFKERVTDKTKLHKEVEGIDTPTITKHNQEETYRQTAAFFPEFGKVACVSLGFVTKDGKTKFESFYGTDEVDILKKVRDVFNKIDSMDFSLCGQNIKNFDIPFLAKRYVINGLKNPTIFPKYDTKPWEMKVLDTKEVWSFGGKYGLSSLDLICMSLNVDSPKNGDVKGDNVNTNFWIDNHEEIKEYCEKDVKALIDIIKKFNTLK